VTGAILPDAKSVATVEWIRSNCRGLALNSCIPRMSACLPLVKRGLIVVSPRLPITTTLPNGASRAKLWARFTFASISRDHVDPGWGYAADLVEVTGSTVIKRMERRWPGVVPAPPATRQWRLPARRRPSTPQRRQADAAGGAVYQHRVSTEDVAAVVRGVLGDEDPRAGLVGDVVCKGLELCGGMGEGVGGVR